MCVCAFGCWLFWIHLVYIKFYFISFQKYIATTVGCYKRLLLPQNMARRDENIKFFHPLNVAAHKVPLCLFLCKLLIVICSCLFPIISFQIISVFSLLILMLMFVRANVYIRYNAIRSKKTEKNCTLETRDETYVALFSESCGKIISRAHLEKSKIFWYQKEFICLKRISNEC